MKDLTLALDIGTTSVGWAIIDNDYKIVNYKDKDLWGVRLFDSASTAETRRTQRGARRRYLRRRRRLELLQLLFQDEINKIDKSFFDVEVKNDSWLKNRPVDKDGKKHANFENKSLAEVLKTLGETPRKYENIYFLQKDIIKKNEKIDLRLLYLAIYSNVKYRGHFLNEFNFMNFSASENMQDEIKEYLGLDEQPSYINDVIDILNGSEGIKRKRELLKECVGNEKIILEQLCLLSGAKIDINKLFTHEDYKGKKYSVTLKDEEPFKDYEISDDDIDMLKMGHNIYLNILIGKILGDEDNICMAQVNAYKIFNDDLKLFKQVIKEYSKSNYKKIFRKHGLFDNYLYGKDYSTKDHQKLSKDESFNKIGKILMDIKSDDERVVLLKGKFENDELFMKQRSKINAATPHQLKARDVHDMLQNQREFYTFITDDFIEKVTKLITYRIPYYVGPLIKKSDDSEFGWLTRTNSCKITPWNIDDIIDKDQTAEEFINRMVGRCTFLYNVESKIDNKAMPLDSLTYQLYKVYNELNGIRIVDTEGSTPRLLTKDEKKKLIDDGFKKNKTLKLKKAKDILGYNSEVELKGAQDKDAFASTLSTYIFFKRFVDEPLDNIDDIDEIVRILTVFKDDEIIKRQLQSINIVTDNYKEIKDLKVSGWGRICKYLLTEIKTDNKSIMDYLIAGSDREVINLQKLITSDSYDFKEKIDELNKTQSKKIRYEDVENLAGSPSLKRGIWQTLLIVDELIKTHKLDIKNISLEFAGGDEKKQRSKKFTDLMKEIANNSKFHKDLLNQVGDVDYSNQKIRLYLLQQGKCLYSGESLSIEHINSSDYEVDHIRARSFTKDNSIDNLALVKRVYNQKKQDDKTALQIIPSKDQYSMKQWWKSLYDYGAISQIKYQRLLKESYSDVELNRFLQRTIVETRQIGKHVKEMLGSVYNDIKVYNVSSHFTDAFRKKLEIPKIRDLSIKHHCEDAFMLAVTTKYTLDKYGEDFFELGKKNTKLWYSNKESLTTRDKSNIVLYNLLSDNNRIQSLSPIEHFKSEMNKDFLRTIRTSYAGKEEFWNETNYSPSDEKNAKYDFVLKDAKIKKSNYNVAYLLLIEYDKKKGKKYARNREIIKVDNIVDQIYKDKGNKYNNIARKLCPSYANISVIRKLQIGQLIDDGTRYTIKNDSEKTNFNEFPIPTKIVNCFNCFTNEKKLRELDLDSAINCFNVIVKYVEDNFEKVLGSNVLKIRENCDTKYVNKDINDFDKKLQSKIIEQTKNNELYKFLEIDLILSDSQLQSLSIDDKNVDEAIKEIAIVYSNGCSNVRVEALNMIKDAIDKKRSKVHIEALSKCVKDIIKAISIGAGRSDNLRIGRIESKINISDFRLVHQSPTGIIEYKSEPLSTISKDKKLSVRY